MCCDALNHLSPLSFKSDLHICTVKVVERSCCFFPLNITFILNLHFMIISYFFIPTCGSNSKWKLRKAMNPVLIEKVYIVLFLTVACMHCRVFLAFPLRLLAHMNNTKSWKKWALPFHQKVKTNHLEQHSPQHIISTSATANVKFPATKHRFLLLYHRYIKTHNALALFTICPICFSVRGWATCFIQAVLLRHWWCCWWWGVSQRPVLSQQPAIH